MSFGSDNFGSDNFGSSGETGGSLSIVSVVAINSNLIEVTFSADIAGTVETTSVSNYTINGGLTVLGVWIPATNQVRISTTDQLSNHLYTLTVNTDVIGAAGEVLTINTAQFTSSSVASFPVVTDLKARTSCLGKRIDLMWTLPAGAEWIRIVRSEDNPILDLTDPHTVVYNNVEVSEFSDTGLEEDKFYYYAVLAASVQNPLDSQLLVLPQSKVECLSISEKYYEQSKTFLVNNTPDVVLELDSMPVSEGGGEGFMEKINNVMVCWVALMRGRANIAPAYNDPDRVPFSAIPLKLAELGLTADGSSYDLSVPRRMLKFGPDVIRSHGSTPGIRMAINMLSGWQAEIVPISLNKYPYRRYGRAITTYDGKSKRITKFAGTLTQAVNTLNDSTLSLTANEWAGGTAVSTVTGDIADIVSNTSTQLTFKTATPVGTLVGSVAAGAFTFTVQSPGTVQIKRGMTIQVTSGSSWQIFKTTNVTNAGVVTVQPAVQSGGFPAGAAVSIELSNIRSELVVRGTVTEIIDGSYSVGIVDTASSQVINNRQFVAAGQFSIWVEGMPAPAVITNNSRSLVNFDAGIGLAPAGVRNVAICRGTFGGASYAARVPTLHYTIRSKHSTTTYNPNIDLARRGSKYDQANRFVHGRNPFPNSWGSNDVLVYLSNTIPTSVGQCQAPAVGVDGSFTLDPAQPTFADGSLVGYYLNPNQAQNELVKITGNTSTKLFTEIGVLPLVSERSYYFIMSPRNAAKYAQLVRRINRDFSHDDITVRFLFA